MGSSSSSSISTVPEGEELMKETGFSAAHLLRLHQRFQFLDKDARGELGWDDLDSVSSLALNPIGDWIIAAFFSQGKDSVDFPSFVRVLAHFRPSGSRRSGDVAQRDFSSRNGKLRFAFQMYDRDGDGKISRDELLQALRAMMGLQVTEEQLQSIGRRAIAEADLDGDDALSFDEFRKSLEKVDIDHKMSIRFLK